MHANEQFISSLLDKVSDRIANDLRKSIAVSVEQEIQKNISRMLLEGEFFRHLSGEMQDGLKRIYKEINSATRNGGTGNEPAPSGHERTGELLHETSDQLDQILQTTEKAAVEIMDIVEKQMELQAEVEAKLAAVKSGTATPEQLAEIVAANQELGADLMTIMTALSFQDLTGQRVITSYSIHYTKLYDVPDLTAASLASTSA